MTQPLPADVGIQYSHTSRAQYTIADTENRQRKHWKRVSSPASPASGRAAGKPLSLQNRPLPDTVDRKNRRWRLTTPIRCDSLVKYHRRFTYLERCVCGNKVQHCSRRSNELI